MTNKQQQGKIETPITITVIWLRRIGDNVQVLAETDGKFRLAITEHFDGPFSHIAEGNGAYLWPEDKL